LAVGKRKGKRGGPSEVTPRPSGKKQIELLARTRKKKTRKAKNNAVDSRLARRWSDTHFPSLFKDGKKKVKKHTL